MEHHRINEHLLEWKDSFSDPNLGNRGTVGKVKEERQLLYPNNFSGVQRLTLSGGLL
jgi:hypothetical protein